MQREEREGAKDCNLGGNQMWIINSKMREIWSSLNTELPQAPAGHLILAKSFFVCVLSSLFIGLEQNLPHNAGERVKWDSTYSTESSGGCLGALMSHHW